MPVEVGCLQPSPKTLDRFSESPALPLRVPAFARRVEIVIFGQLAIDASKTSVILMSFFRSRVLKAH